jgi:hypothetical protein
MSGTRLWTAGFMDNKKVVELRGVDLDRYVGRVREEVRISVAGSRHKWQKLSLALSGPIIRPVGAHSP